ncbi:MAG: hypothetical protein IKW39_00590 [Alphaproteobacteria bacterium]|nr:hypothetical protein [Alphaproteobacteria bacterium]
MSMKKCDDVIDFDKDKLLKKYSILNEESILRFFRENKNLWLVTDKIDDFSLLSDKFLEIKDRMIVEVFSVKKFREAMVFGFRNIAFNVKNKKDVKTVLENGIKMITISLRTAKNIKDELKILKENKVAILGYSAKNFAEVKDLEDFIDMFYYDGEDNLETFFR